jgi:hypothetical protein
MRIEPGSSSSIDPRTILPASGGLHRTRKMIFEPHKGLVFDLQAMLLLIS